MAQELKMFQYLIGRVKIELTQEQEKINNKFQYLIGRVKIIEREKLAQELKMFQYLIGRVKIYKNYSKRK